MRLGHFASLIRTAASRRIHTPHRRRCNQQLMGECFLAGLNSNFRHSLLIHTDSPCLSMVEVILRKTWYRPRQGTRGPHDKSRKSSRLFATSSNRCFPQTVDFRSASILTSCTNDGNRQVRYSQIVRRTRRDVIYGRTFIIEHAMGIASRLRTIPARYYAYYSFRTSPPASNTSMA